MNQLQCSLGQWKLVEEEAVLPDGRVAKRVRAYHPDTVHIIAHPSDETILLLREYRPFLKEWIWKLPGGRREVGEDVLETAQRELQEETGKRGQTIDLWLTERFMEVFQSIPYVCIATGLIEDPLPQDATEMIEVHEVPLVKAVYEVCNDKYSKHLITSYALLRYGVERGIVPKARG